MLSFYVNSNFIQTFNALIFYLYFYIKIIYLSWYIYFGNCLSKYYQAQSLSMSSESFQASSLNFSKAMIQNNFLWSWKSLQQFNMLITTQEHMFSSLKLSYIFDYEPFCLKNWNTCVPLFNLSLYLDLTQDMKSEMYHFCMVQYNNK